MIYKHLKNTLNALILQICKLWPREVNERGSPESVQKACQTRTQVSGFCLKSCFLIRASCSSFLLQFLKWSEQRELYMRNSIIKYFQRNFMDIEDQHLLKFNLESHVQLPQLIHFLYFAHLWHIYIKERDFKSDFMRMGSLLACPVLTDVWKLILMKSRLYNFVTRSLRPHSSARCCL